MASTRKAFIAAASAAGAGLALGEPAQAQTPAPTPSPASTIAREYAERMRRFDPHLTGEQLQSIARQVDQLGDLRTQLRPKGRGLSNADAPSPQFRVNE